MAHFQGSDGDRRQEIVFIGTNMNVEAIHAELDACLLSDEEMVEYRNHWAEEEASIQKGKSSPRFKIGAKVECSMDEDGGRARGTVIDHFYREPGWPPAHSSVRPRMRDLSRPPAPPHKRRKNAIVNYCGAA